MNTFIQQGHIKLTEEEHKVIYMCITVSAKTLSCTTDIKNVFLSIKSA